MLSDEELKKLKNSKSEAEWNATCDLIKQAHGGYPQDWFSKVIASGLISETRLSNGW